MESQVGGWPPSVAYLVRPRLEKAFPAELVPLVTSTVVAGCKKPPPPSSAPFNPRPTKHPASVGIKLVNGPKHPAHGQRCLVALKRLPRGEFLLPYLGVVHASFTRAADEPDNESTSSAGACGTSACTSPDPHADSDYDLSLLRLSASDMRNPFPGIHVSIGVDAASAGNAARFVNDYRGVNTAAGPNAEFRLGRGEEGELRMEVWTRREVQKGEELLVSYGKGWWGARTS